MVHQSVYKKPNKAVLILQNTWLNQKKFVSYELTIIIKWSHFDIRIYLISLAVHYFILGKSSIVFVKLWLPFKEECRELFKLCPEPFNPNLVTMKVFHTVLECLWNIIKVSLRP